MCTVSLPIHTASLKPHYFTPPSHPNPNPTTHERIIDSSGDFHLQVTSTNPPTSIAFIISLGAFSKNTVPTNSTPTSSIPLPIPSFSTISTSSHWKPFSEFCTAFPISPSPNPTSTPTPKTSDQLSFSTLYHIFGLSIQYFKIEDLEPWFTNFWSSRQQNAISTYDMKVLLYPAYIFRHAEAFARITKSLVLEWRSDEMHGANPLTGRAEFRFEHRIWKQLVRIETRILEREITNNLLDPLDHLCNDSCETSGNCMVAYNKSLRECLGTPSIVRRNCSIRDRLESGGIRIWKCTPPLQASDDCSAILCGKPVAKIKKRALHFWEGMCIECVLRTSWGHPLQEQFWEDGRRKRYGTLCPMPHNYQTWKYSYMGPFELISHHVAEQKEREKHQERTKKHGMKFSGQSGFPHASNSNSPKKSHRRSSIAEWTSKNEAVKMKEIETSTDPNRPGTQEITRSFNTSKIAEWTARNLANQARIKEDEAEAEAKAEEEAEAAAG
ncbi:hypothetical protein BOTCAL_0497g00090 [Botryotinia calthae]|uniref:Uncharacterized protein n=1 Tax=Botryotinia calthae TaxID=38488 RepID=A0A4Y8CP40_9HELO|nr:hypothetical protein BOTCAL_0497g00090 [Botryotinia calthae]